MSEQIKSSTAPALADPLIAALVAKLPPPGDAFCQRDRDYWLQMIVLTLNMVYGTDAVESEIIPRFVLAENPSASPPPTVLKQPAPPSDRPNYYSIDPDGFALRNGQPIAPEDMPTGVVMFDEREDPDAGDLASILWKGEGAREPEKLPALNLQTSKKSAAA